MWYIDDMMELLKKVATIIIGTVFTALLIYALVMMSANSSESDYCKGAMSEDEAAECRSEALQQNQFN